jgi:hypothetical protein
MGDLGGCIVTQRVMGVGSRCNVTTWTAHCCWRRSLQKNRCGPCRNPLGPGIPTTACVLARWDRYGGILRCLESWIRYTEVRGQSAMGKVSHRLFLIWCPIRDKVGGRVTTPSGRTMAQVSHVKKEVAGRGYDHRVASKGESHWQIKLTYNL